jgi:hypothetical protein
MKAFFARLLAYLLNRDAAPTVAPVEKAKPEPIKMQITVDTTEIKAALALLEQIVVEAKAANTLLGAMSSDQVAAAVSAAAVIN